VQLALLPEAVDVRALDAQAVAGARTRVRGVWQVRYEREPAAHRVFSDRHGWSCEEHGPRCRAVADARTVANAAADTAAGGTLPPLRPRVRPHRARGTAA
jgi:hypothetical protein